MKSTNATDPCSGDWPLYSSLPAPLALRNSRMLYHSVGPISNFGAAMSGCCGANVDIYDASPAPAPIGCYYYCMFDADGSQHEYAQIRDCIVERGYEYKDRSIEQNGTRSWFLADGRSPDQVTAAGVSLRLVSGFGIWRCLLLGLAFAGGIARPL